MRNRKTLYAGPHYTAPDRRTAERIDRAVLDGNHDIPIINAPVYVLSNDTFFSGWGLAKDMINTVVVPCANEWEARQVVAYIERTRTDQNRVRVVFHKPRHRRNRLLSQVYEWRYRVLDLAVPYPQKAK